MLSCRSASGGLQEEQGGDGEIDKEECVEGGEGVLVLNGGLGRSLPFIQGKH